MSISRARFRESRTPRQYRRIFVVACALATFTAATLTLHAQHRIVEGQANDMAVVARTVAAQHVTRALHLERDARWHEAEATFRRAVDADPTVLQAHLGLARMLARRSRAREAMAVLASVPPAALEHDDAAVELAEARAGVGDIDGALALLVSRRSSTPALRAHVRIATERGRFPEALASARVLLEREIDEGPAADARRLVRALTVLVGTADVVRRPGSSAPTLRRVLASLP